MAYDPNLPPNNAQVTATVLRAQFNGLKELIDAIPAGPPGPPGETGATGGQGPAGEVTAAQLASAIAEALLAATANSSANTNAVATLGQPADSNYNQTQMQELINKLDELILMQRR